MLLRCVCLAALLALPLSAPPLLADVVVDYAGLSSSRDAGLRHDRDRRQVAAELDRDLQKLGRRYLRPGQTLELQIAQIDLAGDYEPWRSGFQDVRILRDITPPRIVLRYQLVEDGRLIAQGQAKLGDMNYLSDPRARGDGTPLIHEKLLLRDWFRKTFAAAG
ncbi:DUF3016 domain-containing protein [Paracoccus shanxieyensis]|nr:DUF3016 domain-containing protein [Paracoccus shanxieyensis]